MKTYVITGATGRTGKAITEGLLAKNHKVRIISRSREKSKDLIDKGADFFEGSHRNPNLLADALRGADAAYFMIPMETDVSDYTEMQKEYAHTFANASRETKLEFAVTLSSVGAHLAQGNGVVQGLHFMEDYLNKIQGLNVLHLRAGYFMENIQGMLDMINNSNIIATPIKANLPIPMVATRDISARALQHLQNLDFVGNDYEYVLGPEDISYNNVTEILSRILDKPGLSYIETSYDDARNAFINMGMGKSLAGKMIEFMKAMNEGQILSQVRRKPAFSTPTSFEKFAQTTLKKAHAQSE